MHPEEFWEADPEETEIFIESFWWRFELEDKSQAHYAAMMVSASAGKRVKPEKIRFYQPEQEAEERSNVTSIDTKRKRKSLQAAFARTRQSG